MTCKYGNCKTLKLSIIVFMNEPKEECNIDHKTLHRDFYPLTLSIIITEFRS